MQLKHGASALVLVFAVLGMVATSDDDWDTDTDRDTDVSLGPTRTLPVVPLRLTPDGPKRMYNVSLDGVADRGLITVTLTPQGTVEAEDAVADFVLQHVDCATHEPIEEQTWTLSAGATAEAFALAHELMVSPSDWEWQTEQCVVLFAQRSAVRVEWQIVVDVRFALGNDYSFRLFEMTP